MTYCFDIDGVLCNNTHGRYELAQPYQQVIDRVNVLYDLGHRVILFTARGTTTGINWRELTEQHMRAWGVQYHQLFFGKPEADIFVDDRAMGPVLEHSARGTGRHARGGVTVPTLRGNGDPVDRDQLDPSPRRWKLCHGGEHVLGR